MDFAEKVEKFKETAASVEARQAHAAAVGEMIKEILPEESTVRSIFTVEVLPPGTAPIYTPDIAEFKAYVLPKMGEVPLTLVGLEEITIPTFEVTSDVSYKIRDARNGRINVAERAMQRLKDSIVALEEEAGWSVIRAACDADRTVGDGTGDLTKELINAAIIKMRENREFQPLVLFVNAKRAGDIRLWDNTVIDPQTQRQILVSGELGAIWQVEIREYYKLGNDEAYLIDTRPGKLGYMPIANDLQTFDDPTAIKKYRIGIIAYEEVGFGVIDNRAVVKLSMSAS